MTGARISALRAVELGWPTTSSRIPLAEALACAKRITELPRQAVESTKRLLNIQLERAVLAVLDYANTAEEQSFQTEDFREIVTRLNAKKLRYARRQRADRPVGHLCVMLAWR